MAAGVGHVPGIIDVVLVPMADGGPGIVEAVLSTRTGERYLTRVQDPLGRPVDAVWARLDDGTAVIETAEACGLVRLRPEERNAATATTFGVGELVRAALDAGSRRFMIGVGGSGTNDGGAGMAQALGAHLLDEAGAELPPGGLALARLSRIAMEDFDPRVWESQFDVAVDVQNPLLGPEGASAVYGPQKGATPEQVQQLEAAMRQYAAVVRRDLQVDIGMLPGTGAGGGLAAGLVAFCRARLHSGATLIAEIIGLREHLGGADVVLTGEGSLDRQTLYGKAVLEVVRAAKEANVPVIALAGSLQEGWQGLLEQGLTAAFSILPGPLSLEQAQPRTRELLTLAAEQVMRLFAGSGMRERG